MGSKSTPIRRVKDVVYIPTPKQSVITDDEPASVSSQDRIAELCELSFQIQVPETALTKPGVVVSLMKIDTLFHVFIMGNDLVSLTPKQSTMVEVCENMSVRYAGKIVKEKKKLYARFTRITR